MKHQIFTVYDSAAEAYLPPFFLPSKGQALRAFSDAANDPNHMFSKHPADYTLFEIGSFDDSNAELVQYHTPDPMGRAIEFRKDYHPRNEANDIVHNVTKIN